VILSLVIVILLISTGGKGIGVWSAWGLAIYFFGVWGGVEIGRYIEPQRGKTNEQDHSAPGRGATRPRLRPAEP